MPNSVKDLEAPFLFLGVHPLFEEKRIASSSSSSTAVKSASTTIKESNGYFQRFIVRELKGIIVIFTYIFMIIIIITIMITI